MSHFLKLNRRYVSCSDSLDGGAYLLNEIPLGEDINGTFISYSYQ